MATKKIEVVICDSCDEEFTGFNIEDQVYILKIKVDGTPTQTVHICVECKPVWIDPK